MDQENHLLEINLISAQGLKPPSSNLRRSLQTYALVWVDPNTKLRTRVDRVGSENPTWNDKFLFKVSYEFLSSLTSGVSVEIYAVGYLKDQLVGTVRFLLSNCPAMSAVGSVTTTPSFIALQIRRPSGRFYGVLNLAATLTNGSDFAAISGRSAIGYRDLMGKSRSLSFRRKSKREKEKEKEEGEKCCENSFTTATDSAELSEAESTTSSSSSTASTVLKEWNGRRDRDGDVRASGGGVWCGWMMQRKIHLSPSDQNLQIFNGLYGKKK
ncbi:C2 domain [Dillenia turbinata]|uniref:C2 domain n=1 Tax=Dillenia turbinata TaxID=194707 RepID=A0AAN8UUF7_9MAGN